jgi:hypothetical protein
MKFMEEKTLQMRGINLQLSKGGMIMDLKHLRELAMG